MTLALLAEAVWGSERKWEREALEMVVDVFDMDEVLPRLARDACDYIPDHQKAVGRHHMKREG